MTKIVTAEAARHTILEAIKFAGRDEVMESIMQWNNTIENDVDENGRVWVASPQMGHWLNDDHLIEFANFINAQ